MSEIATTRIERDDQVIVAVLSGEIDPSNARALSRDLTDAVPNDALALLVDLTDVGYLDSAGVQLLFELADRLAARQQLLAIAVPKSAPARRVLDIVAIDATAPVADSRAEALARLDLGSG